MDFPNEVTIIEVGPRDGLQNDLNIVPTNVKIQFIHALKAAGIKEMEIASFVSPKWVPQMGDASDIVLAFHDSARNIVLTPNKKGVDRALQARCKAVAVFVGVSNTFNQKNINVTTSKSLEDLKPIIKELKEKNVFVRACISTSFYCPYEGKINQDDVIKLCTAFVDFGVDELSVADTVGMANPLECYRLFLRLKHEFPHTLLTAHFHDTRGMAIANIVAALQAGITRFDTSIGGLGGCPFAKGATGNVATEDVVFMLQQMGVQTGINLGKLQVAVDLIRPHIAGSIESKYDRIQLANKK